MKEQNQINDGESFVINGKRIRVQDCDECDNYITFVYIDGHLVADDDYYAVHWGLWNHLAKEMILQYFPKNEPERVFDFFEDVNDAINIRSGEVDDWEDLYECYARKKLKPFFNNINKFQEFLEPILEKYATIIEEIKYYGIDGRVFLLGDNTAVLTFWWQENSISPDEVSNIISCLKEQYPELMSADFYIALARKVVPVEEFTGDFEANDEDREQIEKQKEIHLANYGEKRKALNPYLTDRTRHQGQRLQMANGDEMTQAEYNSYLRQESIKRMVKRVIVEYLLRN